MIIKEAAEHLPHLPHIPSPREILKEINRHRLASGIVSAVILGLGGAYGIYSVITGHAGDSNISNSPTNPNTEPQKPSESGGIALIPTPTARPEATITAVPVGGLEPGAPKSRYTELFDRISKGQASEAEIREFNNLAAEQNTVTTWQTEKGETRQLPKIDGLRAVHYATNNRLETIYVAQENNPYGLKEGFKAGVFNPNVSIESKQTGGVVMIAPVVLKLMETNTKGLGLPLPLDVSEGQKAIIGFTEGDLYGNYRTNIELSLLGRANLTNITVGNQVRFAKSLVNDEANQKYWQYTQEVSRIVNPNAPQEEKPYVLFLTNQFTNNVTVPSQFGSKIETITDSKVLTSHTQTNETKRKLTKDDILTAGEAPVFLAANTP